jgi:hypothetical protein
MAKVRLLTVVAVAVLCVSCSGQRIVNTDEPPAATPVTTSTAPSPPPPSNIHLVDAFDYVGHPAGRTAYFFTSPSGSWACAIVPRVKAGCQSATSRQSGMGITGEPESVLDAAGEAVAPNAIIVEREGDPRFVALEGPEFSLDPRPANILQFNRILAAAGFRCNVQESGISCLSEFSGRGFTFSTDGFTPQYTDVPASAP